MTADRTPWIPCGFPGSTEPMSGLGDLARALGGDDNSFTGEVLKLVVKARATPANMTALRRAWPRIVRAWELWMAMNPTPTCDELVAALDIVEAAAPAAADTHPAVTAVLAALGDAGIARVRWGGEWIPLAKVPPGPPVAAAVLRWLAANCPSNNEDGGTEDGLWFWTDLRDLADQIEATP